MPPNNIPGYISNDIKTINKLWYTIFEILNGRHNWCIILCFSIILWLSKYIPLRQTYCTIKEHRITYLHMNFHQKVWIIIVPQVHTYIHKMAFNGFQGVVEELLQWGRVLYIVQCTVPLHPPLEQTKNTTNVHIVPKAVIKRLLSQNNKAIINSLHAGSSLCISSKAKMIAHKNKMHTLYKHRIKCMVLLIVFDISQWDILITFVGEIHIGTIQNTS